MLAQSGLPRQPLRRLTPRERDVILLVIDGLSSEAIGMRLEISYQTVNYHIKHIIDKMQANNRTHAAVLADREWRGICV